VAHVPGRYQFSLPERRQRDGWFRIGTVDVTTTALMVGLGILSIFWYAIDKVTLGKLVFTGVWVRSGDIWRLATWPIANPLDQQGLWVVLTLAFFWFVGHRIEDQIGRTRFTWLMLAMTVLPSALVTLIQFDVQYAAYGLGVLGIALLVVFALDNPSAMFFFGIPAWVIAAIYVGIDALRYLGDRAYEPLVLELGVIAVALVGARQCGLLSHLQAIPKFAGNRARTAKPARRKGKNSGQTVITGPWEVAHSPADQLELDLLLDKISAAGIDSLSKTEKARLNELSKKLRGR
jgi:hypothetical protein